ncbi:MAG: phosphatidylglycerol lysyltransferase domain-containing protein [Candidatus Omnitrophota bacterium]
MKVPQQWIPNKVCLACQVCCRFPSPESDMLPRFTKKEIEKLPQSHPVHFSSLKDYAPEAPETVLHPATKPYPGATESQCACLFFEPKTQACAIYADRPLDCQLYPFLLTYSPTGKRIFLSIDTQCPFVQEPEHRTSLMQYAEFLRDFLEQKEIAAEVSNYPGLIGKENETVFPQYPLSGLTEKLFREMLFGGPPSPALGFRGLTLKDRQIVEQSFPECRDFADHAFAPLYVFSDLIRFYWKKEDGVLWIVAEQGNRFFLPAPPAAKETTSAHLKEGFRLLSLLNPPGAPLRIEGLSEKQLSLAVGLGCECYPKYPEYLYRREDLAGLSGNPYKSKRALCNTFSKKYDFTYAPYQKKDFWDCFHLFKKWQSRKLISGAEDAYAQYLLEDALFVHRRALLEAEDMGLEGRLIKTGGEIKGYTFGYALDKTTWCILLEIADLEVKGLAQYLFREFCREKKEFELVSAMDDSGLERLRRVKESYRPLFKRTPYVAVAEGI